MSLKESQGREGGCRSQHLRENVGVAAVMKSVALVMLGVSRGWVSYVGNVSPCGAVGEKR